MKTWNAKIFSRHWIQNPDINYDSSFHHLQRPRNHGRTPVFLGTRVPFKTLMDYLEAEHPLADFLDDFPTVTHEQFIAALVEAKEAVLTHARVT